jgi:putative peptidoglycan lipid II flippase
MKAPSLLRSMFSFSAMTFISRLLGLVREWSINHVFGVSATTDAFWIAFRIPNFMRRLFAEGSFSTAFVPVLTQTKEKRTHEELRELIARTAGTLSVVLLLVTMAGVGWALFASHYWPDAWVADPVKFHLANTLLAITFPFLFFVSLTALAGGILNSFHRFALPAITPVILNLCMIGGAWWWSRHFAIPIEGLAWSIFVAGILQLAIQFPALRKLDLLVRPRWGWRHPGVQRILQLMLPTLFGSSVAQVNLLLDTFIAAYLIDGSQTWLSNSDRLLEFPLGIFGVALGTVILPSLSRHHVNTDHDGFSRALDWGLRTTLLIAIPAMFGLVLLAKPIVATLFLNGRFKPHDVDMVGLSVSALSFGLPAFALVKVLLPAFYARQDTKTPVRAGVVAMVANMALNVIFVGALFVLWNGPSQSGDGLLARIAQVPGLHLGLALASSFSSYLNFSQLWYALRRDGVYRREPGWGRHLARLALACGLMVAAILIGLYCWPDWTDVPTLERVWHLAVITAVAGTVYLGTLFAAGLRLRDLRGH